MKKSYFVSLALFATSFFQSLCAQSNGTLDLSFGSDGIVTEGTSATGSIALASNGNIYALGYHQDVYYVQKYDHSGARDFTFDSSGLSRLGPQFFADKIISYGTQHLLVTGALTGSDPYPAVVRLFTSGQIDSSFGTNGYQAFNFRGVFTKSVIDQQGRIVLVGTEEPENLVYSHNYLLARLNSHGTIDPSLGSGGVTITNQGNNTSFEYGLDIALQSDGKILICGGQKPTLLRYMHNGQLDASFGLNGKALLPTGPASSAIRRIAVTANGKILCLTNDFGFARYQILRFKTNGTLDSSFADNGIRVIDNPDLKYYSSLIVQPDQKILLAGSTTDGYQPGQFRIVRMLEDATPDPDFGSNGVVTTAVNDGLDPLTSKEFITALLLQPDGKILAAGSRGMGQLAMARFHSGLVETESPDSEPGAFDLFPNPNTGNFSIKTLHEGNIFVVDMQGKVLMKNTVTAQTAKEIQHQLSAGMYIVILKTKEGNLFKRKLSVFPR